MFVVCSFFIIITKLYVFRWTVWVASFVDLRVFWQPGSVGLSVLLFCCVLLLSLFEPNKYLLLLLLLNGTAPQYLAVHSLHCVSVSAIASRQHHAFCRLSSAGSTALSTEIVWTSDLLRCRCDDVEFSLPRLLHDLVHTTSVFARLPVLETFFFSEYERMQRIRGCVRR